MGQLGRASCLLPTTPAVHAPIAGATHRLDHIYGIARLDSGKVSAAPQP